MGQFFFRFADFAAYSQINFFVCYETDIVLKIYIFINAIFSCIRLIEQN